MSDTATLQTLEQRVEALEAENLYFHKSITNFAGLIRRMTAAEFARADGWAAVLESHEFRNLITDFGRAEAEADVDEPETAAAEEGVR